MVRYYDEKLYLNGDSSALSIIKDCRENYLNERNLEYEKYIRAIKNYYMFLDSVVKLLLSLKIHTPLEYAIAIRYLIINGYLSYNGNYCFSCEFDNELMSNFGMNIICGSGCCRHEVDIFCNLFSMIGLYSKKFYCNHSFFKYLNFNRKRAADHVISLINYEDLLYGFDITNNMLFRFVNQSQMKSLTYYDPVYLTYKPYYEMIFDGISIEKINDTYKLFDEKSKGRYMNVYEYKDLNADTISYLKGIDSLLHEFSKDTGKIKNKIYFAMHK